MKFKFKINGACQVTQLDNGVASHKGSTAWDLASVNGDPYLAYSCNVDVVCKAVNKTYAFVWWETKEKVELADGTEDYLTIMTGHDETINAYVGMNVKANVQLGNMGAGGTATGKHLHIEFGRGKYVGTWYANSYGVYVLYNAIPFTDATYFDDLEIVEPFTYDDVIERWNEVTPLFKYEGLNDVIIDVSSWQENIDYAKVKNTGVKGVILRCGRTGYGTAKSKQEDSTFKKHYEGFKKVGLPVGAYYYSCAVSEAEAREEANLVLSILKGKQFEYPIYFDTEDNHDIKGAGCSPVSQYSIGKTKLTQVAKAFLETVEKAGYYVGIYASTSWLNNQLDMSQLKNYDVWVAHYNVSKPSYAGDYGMWQYTSSGKVSGISGDVDCNRVYKDYPAIIKKAGLNGYSSGATKPSTDELEKVKQELTETKKALETAQNELETQKAEVTRLKKKVNDARAILNAS